MFNFRREILGHLLAEVEMLSGGASCIGEAHKRAGIPLQDCFGVYNHAEGKYSIAVVSDGAGSAKHAEIGSSKITNEFISEIKRLCDKSLVFSNETFKESVSMAIQSTRTALVNDGYALRDCHATIVAAVTFSDRCFLVHLGDGLALAFIQEPSGAIAVCASEPENGDASNETFFYTEDNWLGHLRITEIPRAVLGCMLMSDGMEDFAWNPESGIKESFSKPIFEKAAQANKSSAELNKILSTIVSDERTNQYTNDDKTLCLIISDAGQHKLTAKETVFNQYVIRGGSPVPFRSPASSKATDGQSLESSVNEHTTPTQVSPNNTKSNSGTSTSKQEQVAKKYKRNSLLKIFIFFFSYLAVLLIGVLIGRNFKGPLFPVSTPPAMRVDPRAMDETTPSKVDERSVIKQEENPKIEIVPPKAIRFPEKQKTAAKSDKPDMPASEAKTSPSLMKSPDPQEPKKILENNKAQDK